MKKRYFSIASSDFPQSVDHLYGKLKLCLFLKWVLNLVSWHAGMQEAMSLPSEEVSGCQMTSTGIQHESRYPDQRDNCKTHTHTQPFLQPFFRDYPGEPVPEVIFFWTYGAREIAETYPPTTWLGATPSGLISDPPPSSAMFMPDALPATTLPIYPSLGQAPNDSMETVHVKLLRRTLVSSP